MKSKTIRLPEIGDPRNLTCMTPWEVRWLVFGPIPNPGNTHSWPGKIGFSPLPLDGAISIPETIEILGSNYSGLEVESVDGEIDFTELYPPQDGCPIVYMMTEMQLRNDKQVGISFGADWGTQWWHNGREIFDTKGGNLGDSGIVSSNQFVVEFSKGSNLLVVKLIAGSPSSWRINLALNENYAATACANEISVDKISKNERACKRDYSAAGLRLECRNVPLPTLREIKLGEKVISCNGCQAHWIGVVDHTGSAMAFSDILPPGEYFNNDNEDILINWVKEIHRQGMSAITWFPGMHSKSYAEEHPDHRAVTFNRIHNRKINDTFWESRYNLCPNSPYGEALINFTIESIEKYDLDGFWFDGVTRSHQDLGCVCEYCRKEFRGSTGMNLPEDEDWSDPVFRQWVKWRYDNFMNYWDLLAARVEKHFSRKIAIVVNHLHRIGNSWHKGIPLGRYKGDVIAGTESQDNPFVSAFHARLQRAYKKSHSEVWMGLNKLFTKNASWPDELNPVNRYKHHVMAVLTAGSQPSIGSGLTMVKLAKVCGELSALVNPRSGLNSPDSVPYFGLYLSQQAETFHFSRLTDGKFPEDYWATLFGWHNIAMENQFLTDILFDEDITSETIKEYPVVAAFNSVSLSDQQVKAFGQYVNNGGILLTDRYFGSLDEWGDASDQDRLTELLGDSGLPAPAPTNRLSDNSPNIQNKQIGEGQIFIFYGNPGLAFLKNHSRGLAARIGALVRNSAVSPPVAVVNSPANIHLGAFMNSDELFIHIQNFIAYSGAESFPNPVLLEPEEIKNVIVEIRDMKIRSLEALVENAANELDVIYLEGTIKINIPTIRWGEILRVEIDKTYRK